VSFYWGQTTAHPDGTVPEALTTAVSPYYVAMRGTNQKNPRCVALTGEIGQRSICQIYEQRSTTCREFTMGSEPCQRARAHFGLPPVTFLEAGDST
jgi:Fe-S-cluster containining protein